MASKNKTVHTDTSSFVSDKSTELNNRCSDIELKTEKLQNAVSDLTKENQILLDAIHSTNDRLTATKEYVRGLEAAIRELRKFCYFELTLLAVSLILLGTSVILRG